VVQHSDTEKTFSNVSDMAHPRFYERVWEEDFVRPLNDMQRRYDRGMDRMLEEVRKDQ